MADHAGGAHHRYFEPHDIAPGKGQSACARFTYAVGG
jgi:hypothetical protein